MSNYKDKKCVVCGVVFKPSSPKQKTCSNKECKVVIRRITERERYRKKQVLYQKICKLCSKEFFSTDSRKVYCGHMECEEKRRYIKNKGIEEKRFGTRSEEKKEYYLNNNESIKKRNKKYYREILHPDRDVKEGWSTEKLTYGYVKSYVEGKNHILLSDSYINTHIKLDIICPNGHNWSTSFHNFKDCTNECPKCVAKRIKSKPEEEIYDFVCSIVGKDEIEDNDRKVLGGKELDIYIPSKKVAIEYCGLYWHSEVSGHKDRKYHYNKMKSCNDRGIRLITIFEDEYTDKPEVVLSRVQNALGTGLKRIYARKCVVDEIDTRTAKNFLIKYHLQGNTGARVKWGLFYEGELIQVLTCGVMSRTHTGKLKGVPDAKLLELKRFASRSGVSVIGGAGRLFKVLKKYAEENGFTHIKSYCDMRFGNNFKPVYEILGFSLLTHTCYTPHYTRGGKRFRNQGLRKTPEERLTGLTEWGLRRAQGYDRIWDCGHRTYLYEI